jgi:hypothetical protein
MTFFDFPPADNCPLDLAEHVRRVLRPDIPERNHLPDVSDRQFATARESCQLLSNAIESVACEIRPLLPSAAASDVMQALVRERIATALVRVLRRFENAIVVRFTDRRIVDNEQYFYEVTDVLTGEREEFGWSYGGGQAATRWKAARLLALAGKGVTA